MSAAPAAASGPSFVRAFAKDVGGTGVDVCTTSCQAGSTSHAAGAINDQNVALDSSGNVYVADFTGHRVSVFDPSGNFIRAFGKSVNATDGSNVCTALSGCRQGVNDGSAGSLGSPTGVAVSGSDNVYVTDFNSRVSEFTKDGTFVRAFGKNVGGTGVDVCDTSCQRGTNGAAAGAVEGPWSVAVSGSSDVYVSDTFANRVSEYTQAGTFVRAFGKGVNTTDGSDVCTAASGCRAGSAGGAAGQLNSALDVAVGGGEVYVVDNGNQRIVVFTTAGAFARAFGKGVNSSDGSDVCTAASGCKAGSAGTSSGQLRNAFGVAVSSSEVYVADQDNQRIDEFTMAGTFVRAFGKNVGGTGVDVCTTTCAAGIPGSAAGQFNNPRGVAVGTGDIYVDDIGNSRVDEYNPDATAPSVTLTAPANGAVTNDSSPEFAGTGGTATGDSATVTVKIWSGSSVGSGAPDYTVSATRDGSTGAYSTSGPFTKVSDSSSVATLPDGTYTARAFQSDAATNVGQSTQTPTFTIDTVKPSSSASSPAFTNSGSITVGYTADGTGSALDKVELYAKGPTDSAYAKVDTDSSPAASGHQFTFSATEGDGDYAFYTVAYDKAGNVEDAPASADSTTTLDTAKPTSSASSPAFTNGGSITVGYTADGTRSALDKVELYAKGPTDSAFAKVDTDSTPAATGHNFTYSATEGDGDYAFYTVAYDKAGNVEDAPASADSTTTLDTAKPTSSASSPAFTNGGSITVGYTADGTRSALDKVELYAKGPTDSAFAKVDTDSTPAATGHNFTYSATEGDGDYAFYTVAYDKAGNVEDAPASADSTTTVDTLKPTSSASSPALANNTSVEVSYTANGTGSPLDKVELYAKGPTDSAFAKVDTDSTPAATGHNFTYSATEGDGDYAFYTVAYDKAGNVEDPPASADSTTTVDTVKPSSSASSPAFSNGGSIEVGYTANDLGSGLDKVELYAKAPGENSFSKVDTDSSAAASGHHFTYTPSAGDGVYAFYTVAYDKAGNVEDAPASADSTTTVDTVKPTSSASAPAFANNTSIEVSYTADGTGSPLDKVELYVKGPSDGAFAKVDTDSSPAASGHHFSYAAGEGDGSYAFYTLAYDKAGNVEDAPATPDAVSFALDTAKPSSSASSPAFANGGSIEVSYTADGTGSALDKVELYAKASGQSSYSKVDTDSSPAPSGHHFTYTPGAGDGDYAFYTIAYDKAGNVEDAPASADSTTTVDTAAPSVSLTAPANGTVTSDSSPEFAGSGGTAAGDNGSVTVKIWSGSSVGSGAPDYTVSATRDGSTGAYSTSGPYTKVSDSSSHATLPHGTYTARAFQSDAAGNIGQSSQTPTFTINTAPVAVDDSASTPEDTPLSKDAAHGVLANDTDADGDALKAVLVSGPAHGSLTLNQDGSYTYTPAGNYNGPDSFSYKANDGTSDSASNATVSIDVTAVDDAPTAANDSATVAQDGSAATIDVLANDTDPDGGPKTIASKTNGAHGTVTITHSGADLTYKPDAGYCNSASGDAAETFTYTLNGGSTATVTVKVTCTDTDGDGTPDRSDPDIDGDGVPNAQDAFPLDRHESVDTDGDGTGNNADTDDDNDGVPDTQDAFPLDKHESVDTDGDGIGNNADTDDDNDGVPDSQDTSPLDPTKGSPNGPPEPPALPTRLSISHRGHLTVRNGSVALRLRCKGAADARCIGTLLLDPAPGKTRLKAASARGGYGKAKFNIAAGKSPLIRVKATTALLQNLRKRHHVITLVTANYTGRHGGSLSVERKLTLALPKH